MALHPVTFNYIQPTPEQITAMTQHRVAAAAYADAIDRLVPDGPDKTHMLRQHRTNAMWGNVAITRQPDGAPRT